MARSPDQILAVAKANGYRIGAHKQEDNRPSKREYKKKGKAAHDGILDLYVSYVGPNYF